MSLCCEIGCRERLSLGNFRRGNLPRPSTPPQSWKNTPRKAHKDPVTAEVCTL
ncbi:Hypothetical protein FKW44_009985 [Caligus rogercresseyi]|uniref:Uncharacterized protein n=1 Tax=Caligus rogercresseyi TaxID=217165 RepID=A0A7T8HG42_CALRO|nr:Hypothetical protein FKW44_009985 [Caligus rogercresseyi]